MIEINLDEPKCPFDDPNYDNTIKIEEPCPVCGARGYDFEEVERLCIGLEPQR